MMEQLPTTPPLLVDRKAAEPPSALWAGAFDSIGVIKDLDLWPE
jgi:hypothetical protein